MAQAIVVENLSKKYKLYKEHSDRLKESLSFTGKSYHQDFLANDGISFTIQKGEVVGIIGMNGCGKSTLLKMITGVLTPSSGSVCVHGKITALLELGDGFNPDLSGLDNLYLAGSISGYREGDMKEKIDSIIAFADIGEHIYQPLKTYSSGMKARLGFAFSIHTEPEILIVDEALSVGDAAFQRKCYAKIEQMCSSEEVTVLFVSHAGGVIKQLCNRAILLHGGSLVLDGEPKKVVNLYEKFMHSKDVDVKSVQAEFAKLMQVEKKPQKKIQTLSCYNPNLLSKSLVELPEKGAKIDNIRVLDKNGQKVNVLEKNSSYTYIYDVTFSQDFDDVLFAMRIKDTKGIIISGQILEMQSLKKTKTYTISYEFNNILNNGDYFFNAGANSNAYGEHIKLHRVIDGYMIKVITDTDDSRGIIDMSFKTMMKESSAL